MTSVPPVTAERSPPDFANHGSGLAGDGRFVDRCHTLDHVAIGGNEVARLDENDVAGLQLHRGDHVVALAVFGVRQFLGADVRLRRAKACGLRLAASFGDGFREIREQDREPQPEDDLDREAVVLAAHYEVADEKHRHESRDDFDHEHHRVLRERDRVEFFEGISDGRNQDLRVRDRGR